MQLFFDAGDQETAGWVADAAGQSLSVIRESWGLEPPADCRIYLMTSWRGFIADSAPWYWWPLIIPTYPLWARRIERTWPYSAAWTQRYGRRVAIGIKPPRLLEVSDKSIGTLIYIEELDIQKKINHYICHELTHACSARLSLPAWLTEGIAMLTVDRFLGKPTIRADTMELVRDSLPKAAPPSYRQLSHLYGRELAYHVVRGYWLVKYLEEVRPGFLRPLFLSPRTARTIEEKISAELGIERAALWNQIDDRLAAYFEERP